MQLENIKKILFVIPPSGLYRRDDRCQSKVEDQTVRIIFPPIDLALLAAIAVNNKIEAKIIDYPAQKNNAEHVEDVLNNFNPNILLINTTAGTLKKDLEFISYAKKIKADLTTIAKGESLSHFSKEIFENCPELDLIIYGECEDSFQKLISGEKYSNIKGLIFKNIETNEIVDTGMPSPIEELDRLPFPARNLLDNKIYISPETGNPLTTIHANRGCPAKCIFCPAGKISGFKIRYRSPKSILSELKECVEKYNITEFLFHGDTFTMNKKWIVELCDEIITSGLKIRWGCNSRTDTFDEERAKKMKEAGCWVVAFGVESGSPEMLEKIKKGAKIESALDAVSVCKKTGLRSHAFYVIGLPWETKETLKETFSFAKKLDTDFFDFNIAYPLPGTELYEIAIAEKLIVQSENPFESGGYSQAVMKTHSLSPKFLTLYRRKILLSLYFRPAYILRTILNTGSPKIALNYVKAAIKRLLQLI